MISVKLSEVTNKNGSVADIATTLKITTLGLLNRTNISCHTAGDYTSVCLCVQKLCATPLPLNDRRMGVDVQLVGIPSYTCRITFCSAAKMSRNAYGRDRGHESYNTVAAIALVLRVATQRIASRSQAFSGEEKARRNALKPLVPQECVGHVIMIITLRNTLSYAGVLVVNGAGARYRFAQK